MRLGYSMAIAALALLAGCATTETFSYLDGHRYFKATLDTYDTTVISVDGEHYTWTPVKVAPGPRRIVLQGPPAPGFRHGEQRTLEINIEPCKRYWFAAVKKSRLVQDFEPKVDYVEPIAGCGVPK